MNEKFIELREKYPEFIYQSFEYEITADYLSVVYHFVQSKEIEFFPKLKIPFKGNSNNKFVNLQDPDKLKAVLFNIGMIELISYWKACASPKISIKAGFLSPSQISFWSKIYYNGLGEYLFTNQIETTQNELFSIICESEEKYEKSQFYFEEGSIIPVGGGKDSVVSLDLLKENYKDNYALIMNPRGASLNTAKIAGYSPSVLNNNGRSKLIEIRRFLDSKLLELNKEGYLNGHTPFSALLSFITALAAIVFERKDISLSNEDSASEGNVFYNQLEVNHQYSKSFDAESELNHYIKTYICEDLNYFSLLRPLYELQIAKMFSSLTDFHQDFRSCNKGSKEDIWCGVCPKCLFVYIILSPFLTPLQLTTIFGKNMLEDENLLPLFLQLAGLTEVKPFECVGTYREVKAALALTLRQYKKREKKLPVLLRKFDELFSGEIEFLCHDAKLILAHFNDKNLLFGKYYDFVKNGVDRGEMTNDE